LAVVLVLGTGAYYFAKPVFLVVRAWLRDRHDQAGVPPGFADDASRLNQTPIAEIWKIPAAADAAEAQLQQLLERARSEKLGVSIAGARHSMGGHTISPAGIVIDMLPFKHLKLDPHNKLLHVGAGARWADVIPFLDARGFSPAVMQSNNNFSVGGSISVNCHGWQCRHAPIASTVESFRLMKADGDIVTCSRTDNAELFSLALGGYGLFGIILDVDLRVIPNERYLSDAELLNADQYGVRFRAKVDDGIGMVYGRLCVVPGKPFLQESILTVFRKAPCELKEIPPLTTELAYATLRREIYRAQIGSGAGKETRWRAEKKLGETAKAKFFSRNQLFNEDAEIYQEQNADRTDILHEYFIPADRLEEFLVQARAIIPKHPVDLLNVTVRDLREDKDTVLRYADQDMFALVMLFNQPRTEEADHEMQTFTQALLDAVLACGGRYYLPYRLHATPEQFRRAYPRAAEFFARKRHYDPDGVFVNQFYLKYGAE
jgi:FAD/FMN-containing dehydrogenase